MRQGFKQGDEDYDLECLKDDFKSYAAARDARAATWWHRIWCYLIGEGV